jgi:hypothetical protein
MKHVAFILSLLVLAMSVLTCTDGATCDNGLVADTHVSSPTHEKATAGHNHSEDAQDTCSPFCTCQCCGVSVSLTVFAPHVQKQPLPVVTYQDHYTLNGSQEYHQRIWHPPIFG